MMRMKLYTGETRPSGAFEPREHKNQYKTTVTATDPSRLTLPLCKVCWPDKTELSLWYLVYLKYLPEIFGLPEKNQFKQYAVWPEVDSGCRGMTQKTNGRSTQRRNWPSGRISDNTQFSASQNVIEVLIKYLTRKINKVLFSNWARNQNRYHKTYFFPLRGAQLVHHCSWG